MQPVEAWSFPPKSIDGRKKNNSRKIAVLAVDHGLLAYALRDLLKRGLGFASVFEATNSVEIAELISKRKPNLLMLTPLIRDADREISREFLAGLSGDNTTVVIVENRYSAERERYWMKAKVDGILDARLSREEMISGLRDAMVHQAVVTRRSQDRKNLPSEVVRLLPLIAGLRPRTREVLELLAAGYSNSDIARAINTTESTAKSHVTIILKSLGLPNRYRLASIMAKFCQLGLFQIRPELAQHVSFLQRLV